MNAEIITIGNEILIGQAVNTNSAFLAVELNKLGIIVVQITSVADQEDRIRAALDAASLRAGLIITTGGLGPTNDDITKQVLAGYFGSEMKMYPEVLDNIKVFLESRGVGMNDRNRQQAILPDNCVILPNRSGTAQGMWFIKDERIYCALPGVPYEMKEIFVNYVAPRLKQQYNLPAIHHETILTSGLPESMMAQIIENWEKNLPSHISLAYLPSPGLLRLRLTGTAQNIISLTGEMHQEIKKLETIIGPYILGYNEDLPEKLVGDLLRNRGLSLALAESCTGGKISELITSVPGCSAYYKGGIVAYSNDIKTRYLGVSPDTINTYGAVSQEVAIEMATGVLRQFNSDFSIAVTGVSGPTGGSDAKPVGTTWIAIASKRNTISCLYHFGEHRGRNIQKATIAALFMLKKEIENGS